jgi:sentrin-specific protease 8
MTTTTASSKVLSYGDYMLRQSDIDIILNNQWLNDPIIGFYFEYLSKQYSKTTNNNCMYLGPEVAQLLKLVPKDQIRAIMGDLMDDLKKSMFIFIPVNDSDDPEKHSGGSHWSLLVFSRKDNAFVHFDSSGDSNSHQARIFVEQLSSFVSPTAQFLNMTLCGRQTNGYDCGMHVISNARLISEFVKKDDRSSILSCPTAGPQDAMEMRKHLVELIRKLAVEDE